jgi:choline kinase
LIQRQREALWQAGAGEIVAVTGYRGEEIARLGLRTIHNESWRESNMVASLACALRTVEGPVLVSYSDIVYTPTAPAELLRSIDDVAVAYDVQWERLWRRRFADPLSDAESFRIEADGRITEIGGRVHTVDDIQGQFMGLMKFSAMGVQWVKALLKSEPGLEKTLDSTGLLMHLIQEGKRVAGLAVKGGWCEIDRERDLKVAHEMVHEGLLTLP